LNLIIYDYKFIYLIKNIAHKILEFSFSYFDSQASRLSKAPTQY